MKGLLINENLPASLIRVFHDFGISAVHVKDVALGGKDDSLVWQYALEQQLGVITKDSDYSNIVWFEGRGQVVLVATGNLTLRRQRESIVAHLQEISEFLGSDNLLYIIR